MHRFGRVLFVVGAGWREAPAGLDRAVSLVRANAGRLVLGAEPGSEAELEAAATAAAARGVTPEMRVLRGRLPEAVIRDVTERGHDLVIKRSEDGVSRARLRLFGSPDRRLLRECPCPVWLYPSEGGARIGSVLAAVDVSGRTPGGLSERVVQVASSLAVAEGAALHVVHGWSLYGESVLRSRGRGLEPGRLRSLLRETRRTRSARLEALVARAAVPGSEPTCHVVKARAALAIRHVARRVGADVVVMGTVSRSGASGVLIGNTAEIVLSRLPCAALTVKPAGFRSPLEAGRRSASAAAG